MINKITFRFFCVVIITFFFKTSYAQSDSLNSDDIIKYFESKKTATIYFTRNAFRKDMSMHYGLSKLDKNQKGIPVGIKDRTNTKQFLKKEMEIDKGKDIYFDSLKRAIETMNDYDIRSERNLRVRSKTFQPGDTIYIPLISAVSQQMKNPSNKLLGVHYDYINDSASVYDLNKRIKTDDLISEKVPFDSASFISVDIKLEDDFTKRYWQQGFDSGLIYIETPIEICPIELPESSLNLGLLYGLEELDSLLLVEVQKINTSKVNDFIFFDSFKQPNNGCSHGESVKNIILFVLNHFHASILNPKIKSASLDFFDDRDKALEIITDYLNKKYGNSEIYEPIKKKIIYYKNVGIGNCKELCMPSDYLNILLDYYMMQKPEIISMSFYMKTPYPVMNFFIKNTMQTNLLGAVINNKAAIEYIDVDITGRMNEPIFTLKSNIKETGTILIGAKSEEGNYECLYSSDGYYVTTLGRGNWSSAFDCSPITYGTSWATPEIATKLFIAKAYWTSIGLNIDALEAKRRLLLSCDLEENFVNKFASPGIPNMNKLLRKNDEGFIEMGKEIGDGKQVNNIRIIKNNPKMVVMIDGEPTSLKFKKGKDFLSFSGLYFNGDNIYIFQDSKMKWENLNNLLGTNLLHSEIGFKNFKFLILKTNKTVEVKTLEDFRNNNINQIVVL